MDALSVFDRITSGAALALSLVPNDAATKFSAPAYDLGDVARDVDRKLRNGNEAGAVRRVTRWVNRKLYPAVVDVAPRVGAAVPPRIAQCFSEIMVWGVDLAVNGVPEVIWEESDPALDDGPVVDKDTVALTADRVPGAAGAMLSDLKPARMAVDGGES